MDNELSDFVVKQLAAGLSEQDVILAVCQRAGLTWQQAESIVYGAMDSRATDIARWQMLTFLVLAFAAIAGGVGIIARYVLVVAGPMSEIVGRGDASPAQDTLGPLFWVFLNAQFIGDLILGGAMIVGGAIGLYAAVNKAMGN